MTYNIKLVNNKNNPYHSKKKIQEGGTQILGGTTETIINITYNYSWFYYLLIDKKKGIRWLYGKKAKNCINVLTKTVKRLGIDKSEDFSYWCPTPCNAGFALNILLGWAKEFPDGTFKGD